MHDRKAMNCSALLLSIERNQRYKFYRSAQLFMVVLFIGKENIWEFEKQNKLADKDCTVQPVFFDHVGSSVCGRGR